MNIHKGKGYYCLNGIMYPKSIISFIHVCALGNDVGAISIKLIQYGSYSYIILSNYI